MNEIYKKPLTSFYEKCHQYHENLTEELSIGELTRLKQTINIIPEVQDIKKVLDVGCRDGRLTNLLSDKFQIVGIDIGIESLRKANCKKLVASVENLPFTESYFDLTICTEVLEHLPQDMLLNAIRELKRVTKNYLLISVPYRESLVKGSVKCQSCGGVFHDCGHLHSFSVKKLISFFPEWKPETYSFIGDGGGRGARGLNLFYHVLHYLGNQWTSVSIGVCPLCGYDKVDNSQGNLLGFFIQRIIWRMEQYMPFKNPGTLAIIFKKRDR